MDTHGEFYTPERCFILEIMNSADQPECSLARARVEPGVTTQWHALSVDEIYYVLEGAGIMEKGDALPTQVKVGDAVHIRAGEPQRITNNGETDLIFLCICQPRFTPEAYTALE